MNSVAAKRVFAISLAVALIIMIGDAKAQLLDRALSLRDLSLQLHSPEAVARYMWHNFTFETDQKVFGKEEHWQSAEEFLTNQKGDCEDYAIFANTMLQMNGISSFILNIYGKRFAHTVCVFKENGKYNVIDGTDVLRYQADDLTKLVSSLYPFWKKAAIVKPSASNDSAYGVIVSEFQKKQKRMRLFGRSA